MRWHLEEFDTLPIGDGYEVDVTEFDFRDENGICYQRNGVTVRHWPRSHGKDGASAYRLDWEDTGLSFVWTGDGRPDELTAKYAVGADVFVSEVQSDLGFIASLKYGYPQELYNYIIDTHHTPRRRPRARRLRRPRRLDDAIAALAEHRALVRPIRSGSSCVSS